MCKNCDSDETVTTDLGIELDVCRDCLRASAVDELEPAA